MTPEEQARRQRIIRGMVEAEERREAACIAAGVPYRLLPPSTQSNPAPIECPSWAIVGTRVRRRTGKKRHHTGEIIGIVAPAGLRGYWQATVKWNNAYRLFGGGTRSTFSRVGIRDLAPA